MDLEHFGQGGALSATDEATKSFSPISFKEHILTHA